MSPENLIILYSSKINPTPQELEQLDECLLQVKNWDKLTKNLISTNMGPLFYTKIPHLTHSEVIPQDDIAQLKQSYYQIFFRTTLLYQLLKKSLNILSENGIEVIVLKGAYLSESLYGDIGLRMVSDIDLLCKNEEEAERAVKVLVNKGYDVDSDDKMLSFLRLKTDPIHLPQVTEMGIAIELHTKLHRNNEVYSFPPEKMWEHAKRVILNGTEVNVPDHTDLLIHTCLHLHKHFVNGQIQLTGMTDIVNFLEVHQSELDWADIIGRSIRYMCEDIVFKYLILAYKCYNVSLPGYIVSEYINYCTEEDEALFAKYLTGFNGVHYSVSSEFEKIRHIEKKEDRVKYILWMMFPSRKYMMRSYKITNEKMVWLYYPYRYWIGLRGGIRAIRRNRKHPIQSENQ